MDAKHAPHGLRLWWTILILGAIISFVLNVWHAWDLGLETAAIPDAVKEAVRAARAGGAQAAGIHPVLGFIFAAVPVGFAAMLSHGLISPAMDKWFKAAIVALFALSMLTSISSQAAVLLPYGGGYGAEWTVPIVLDASALLALHYITKAAKGRRETARQADIAADMEALRAELRPAVEADIRAAMTADMEADMKRQRADMEADMHARREADIAAARADIAADMEATMERVLANERAQIEADRIAWIEQNKHEIYVRAAVEAEARVRRELAAATKSPERRPAAAPATNRPADDGLTSEERARILLDQNPGITGAEMGRALGLTERQGRRLLDKVTADRAAEGTAGGRLRAVN